MLAAAFADRDFLESDRSDDEAGKAARRAARVDHGACRPRFEGLAAADDAGLSAHFQAWRGRSGRRYVVSVFPADAVPEHENAVLIAVRTGPDGTRRILAVGCGSLNGRDAGADEVHVHLLARDPAARQRVSEDLG